jgi:preprotein translocase subunit SecB
MEPQNQPGIICKAINLMDIKYTMKKDFLKNPIQQVMYNFAFRDNLEIKPNGDLHFTFFIDLKSVAIDMSLELLGIFTKSSTDVKWDEVTRQAFPTIMFPYVREIISNITSRSPISPLILPPTNVLALIGHANHDKAKEKSTEKSD